MSEFVVSELVAKLRIDKGNYDADINSSKAAFDRLADGAKRAGESITKSLAGGLTAASVSTGIVAAGTIGLLAKVTKTGAAYNMLQQNSRAALASIMGGTDKASKQMDKLDDFARNSPFAKDAFISAQQQLLGFNVEAKKVIPIMDAVQQAVAATGGTSSDVAGLVDVFAKIKGQGKLTGDAIMQLGVRGIDAADILAKAMGKTGEQIRKDIKKGTIGADQAIDILTKGLATKFEGATAGIKKQMTGALDRVKGASRDIGSAIAEPFIRKDGGGRAVIWTNEFADALRAAEKKTGPLVNMLVGRLNPAFNQMSYHMQDIKGWIDRIDVRNVSDGLDNMGKHAPAIAGVSAAFAAMGTQLPILSRLGLSVNPLVAGIAAMVAASPELRGVFADAVAAGKPLLPLIEQLAGHFSKGLNSAIGATIPLLESGVDVIGKTVNAAGPLVDMAGNLVEWFAQLPGPVQTAVVSFAAFAALRGKFDWVSTMGKDLAGTVSAGFRKFRDEVQLTQQAANNMRFPGAGDALRVLDRQISTTSVSANGRMSGMGAAAVTAGHTITRGLKGAATGVMNLFGGPWGIALGAGVMALGAYAAAQAEARQRVQEFAGTLDEATGAITKNTDAMAAAALANDEGGRGFWLVSSGAESAAKTLELLGRSTQETANLAAAGGEEYDTFIQTLNEYKDAVAAAHVQEDVMGSFSGMGDGGAALDAWAEKVGIASEAARQLTSADIVHLVSRLEEQRTAVEGATNAFDRMNDSAAATPNATSAIADAIKLVGDAAGDATGRLQAYKDIIDIMNGVVPNADDQQRKLAATTRTLGEFFKETDENGKLLNNGLINAKDGTIALSDAGDRLNGILRPQVDAALAAAIAAGDHARAMGDEAGAAAAADAALAPMRKTIQGLAQDGSITQAQADALERSLLGIPGKTTAVITDEGSIESVKLRLTDLVKQIEATPDGEITIKENSPEVIEALNTLGYRVENLQDGVIKVTETGAYETGNTIDGVASRHRMAPISVKEIGAAAAGAAIDRQARDRNATIWVKEVPTNKIRAGNEAAQYGQGRLVLGGRAPGLADGGRVPFTGLGTDKVIGINAAGVPHVRVDDREWVVNRKSSDKHDVLLNAINNDDPRLSAFSNLVGLASGGRVGAAETRVKSTKRAYDLIPGGKATRLRKLAAKDQWEAAKKDLASVKKASKASADAAKKAEEARKKAAQEERERQGRLAEGRFDLRRDLRRGNITDSFTSGSGLTMIDRLYDQSKNKDLSKSQRKALGSTANDLEKRLLKAQKQSDKLTASLDKSTKSRDDLLSVQQNTQSSVVGAFDLSGLTGQKDAYGYNKFVGKKGLISYGKSMASGAKTLSGKVSSLQKAGFNAALIEQVIGEWTRSGTFDLADAMLSMNKGERKSFNSAFKDVEKYGLSTGSNLTNAMAKGGISAAEGLVKGLQSQQKTVENAFFKMGKDSENAYKLALGIKSPSTVMAARMGDVVDGSVLGVERNSHKLEEAMRELGISGESAFSMQPNFEMPPAAVIPSNVILDRNKSGSSQHNARPSNNDWPDYQKLAQALVVAVQAAPITTSIKVNEREVALQVQSALHHIKQHQ